MHVLVGLLSVVSQYVRLPACTLGHTGILHKLYSPDTLSCPTVSTSASNPPARAAVHTLSKAMWLLKREGGGGEIVLPIHTNIIQSASLSALSVLVRQCVDNSLSCF